MSFLLNTSTTIFVIMKRILLFLFFSLSVVSMFAQSFDDKVDGHVRFNDVQRDATGNNSTANILGEVYRYDSCNRDVLMVHDACTAALLEDMVADNPNDSTTTVIKQELCDDGVSFLRYYKVIIDEAGNVSSTLIGDYNADATTYTTSGATIEYGFCSEDGIEPIRYHIFSDLVCLGDTATVTRITFFRDSIFWKYEFYETGVLMTTDPTDYTDGMCSNESKNVLVKIYKNFSGDITGQNVVVSKCKGINTQIFKFDADGFREYPDESIIVNGVPHPRMTPWYVGVGGNDALLQENIIDANTNISTATVWLTTVGCESEEDKGFDCENLDCDTGDVETEKRPTRITQINDDDKRIVEVRYDESLDCDDNPIDLTTAEFCQTFVFEDACRIEDENGNTINRSVNFTTAPIFTLCQTASTPTFDWSGSIVNNTSDQALIESFFNFFVGGYQYDGDEVDDSLVGIDVDGNIVGSGTDYLGILGFERIIQPSGCIYYEGAEWKIINATVKQNSGDCEGIISEIETTELLVKKGIKAIAHSSTFLSYANDPQNSYSFYARSETILNTCNFFSDSRVDNVQDNNGDYTVIGIPDSGVKFALYTHGDGSFLHTSNGIRKNGLTWDNYALNHSPKSIPATGNDYLYDLVRSRILNIYNTDYQINIRAIPSFLGDVQNIFSKLSDVTTITENSSLRATRNNTGDLDFYPQSICINRKIDVQRTIQFNQASGNEAPWDGAVSNQEFQITITRTF